MALPVESKARGSLRAGLDLDAAAREHAASAWRRHGDGAYRRVAGLHVLRLRGSFRAMGEQHGALLGDHVARGPMPYYREHLTKLLGRSAIGALAPAIFPTLQLLVGRRVASRLPRFARETLEGLAEGSGVSLEALLEGATMPDSMLWLVSQFLRAKAPGPAVAHRFALGLGCTSAIAWGEATRDGKLLHARNFDYHGVDCWPREAAVMFHEPEHGQRYVSVASAGVPLGGVTAMNEAGLSLTVHQHMFTDRARLGGTPIGVVGDMVMRRARSLDDAEALLEAHRPIGCWTYLVTDGHRREALCWEESPDRNARRRVKHEGTLGYANVYQDRQLGESEIDAYGSYWRHNEARHRRVNELLAAQRGALDPSAMAEILADPGDTRCRLSEAISMVLTVGSVVFRPEDGLVWVGTGDAPTSEGELVPFSLASADHDERAGSLRTATSRSDASKRAFEHYRRAYVAYLDREDVAGARSEMERAIELQPEQPLFRFLAGLCALQARDGDRAEVHLARAIELGHPHEQRRASFHLWRGRARSLAGRRAEARADYARCLAMRADAPVHDAARRDLRRAFAASRAARVSIDFAMADVAAP